MVWRWIKMDWVSMERLWIISKIWQRRCWSVDYIHDCICADCLLRRPGPWTRDAATLPAAAARPDPTTPIDRNLANQVGSDHFSWLWQKTGPVSNIHYGPAINLYLYYCSCRDQRRMIAPPLDRTRPRCRTNIITTNIISTTQHPHITQPRILGDTICMENVHIIYIISIFIPWRLINLMKLDMKKT